MKDTLKIVLIIALVFFGMTFLTKGCQDKKEKETESQMMTGESRQERSVAFIDSINPADVAYAADYIRAAGVREGADIVYNYENVTLRLINDSIVDGIIALNDSTSIGYNDLVAARFPETFSLTQKAGAVNSLRDALEFAGKNGEFARLYKETGEAAPAVLQDSVIRIEFSTRGGCISKATLKKYYTYFPSKENPESIDKQLVNIVKPDDGTYYGFKLRTVGQQEISTADLYFTPRQVNDSIVEMTLDLGNGSAWGYRYTLHPGNGDGGYLISMDVIQRNVGDIIAQNNLAPEFCWFMNMPRQDKSRTFEERNSSIYYKYNGDSPDELDANSTQDREELDHSVSWIAFKNQFFSSVIIPREPFGGGVIEQASFKNYAADADYVKRMYAEMATTYHPEQEIAASFDIFIGPNDYSLLQSIDDSIAKDDLDLTRLIPLGWSWLRWINTLIIIPIFSFLSGFISNYGIIILILTIIIKIVLFPFTYKSYMSQAKMRVLAPEIKEINEKYPGQENAMTRQQKTMALYSRAGASPMSGCLPLLLQMPILIAMFSFFPSCIELRGQSFLWAKDLAAPDVIFTLPFTIPFYGNHVSLFCLLMTVTNVIYSYINMKSQPTSSSMPGMKWMMYLMPVMFLFFFNDYASALSYYYFLSLLITIIQTWIFRRCINEDKLRRKMAENAAKPRKKSGFMARLEEAQRKQQAMLREQQKQQKGGRKK